MKIKISRPDGSIVEAEGTPEECAVLLGIATAGPKESSLEELRKLIADLASRPAPAPIWVSPYTYPWWWLYSTPPIVQPYVYPSYPTWIGTELTIDPNVPCTTTGVGIFLGDPPSTIKSSSTVSLPSLVSQPTFSISFNDHGADSFGNGFATNTLMLSADA